MNRPWQIWISFGAAVALVAAAVGWLSLRALESDKAETAARQQAAVEESVRLALWRMDSLMSAFVAQESARNAVVYEPFEVQPAAPKSKPAGKRPVNSAVPSPLLAQPLPEVFVYFERTPDGQITSPQVPTGALRDQAVPAVITADQVALYEKRLQRLKGLLNFDELLASLPAPHAGVAPVEWQIAQTPSANPGQPANPAQGTNPGQPSNQNPDFDNNNKSQGLQEYFSENPRQNEQRQQLLGINEFRRRSNYNTVIQNNRMSQAGNAPGNTIEMTDDPIAMATMTARVIAGELILARTVSSGGKTWLQGCWIDWEKLRGQLLSEIADLLPTADLKLVAQPLESEQTRMLAALPVRIDVGAIASPGAAGLSPVKMALVVAWGAMLLAALAVAALLSGVVTLSERRADFVSAVTHELRTPLTTFRMYSEMLAEGMVPDETVRRKYLNTLRVEADRLTHLVENVLAYARLERGGLGNRLQPVRGAELLKLATGRLSDRAQAAGLSLAVSEGGAFSQATVLCDASAVEQILFNLVDNACKYAARGADKSLHLEARLAGSQIELVIRDHGPGISPEQRRRLFQPFRKSADDAALSAPGVGLGLALSRRLARDMGGELRYGDSAANGTSSDEGAAFVLLLPLQLK